MPSLGEDDTILGSTLQQLGVPRADPAIRIVHANVMERLFGDPVDARPIGRYVPKKKIGAGANGVVYLATDDVLQRDVALKVLAPTDPSGAFDTGTTQRWLREAQAVARLSHPNVVEIFDLGVDGAHPYLAMELVEGGSLAEWLRASDRSPHEIVEHFLQAGEGLAAAHRLGVVHRDFKPANVLVGRDGRVRVADFGLAGFLHDPDGSTRQGGDSSVSGERSSRDTHTGTVMGTPAFMSPEQHRGERVDARSDQYSFCVALWGALRGGVAFSADSLPALYAAKLELRLADPPRELSHSLRAALVRGMAVDPVDRFPTMEALLAAIRPTPGRARERWVWLACGSAVAAFGVVLALSPGADGACARVGEELADVWNRAARDRIESALEVGGAGELSSRARGRIDAFVRDWTAARTDACEATDAADGADAAAVDAAMRCLRESEGRLRATLDVLGTMSADSVARAHELLHGLGDPSLCRIDAAAREGPPRPDDPALASAVDDVRTERARLDPLVLDRRLGPDDPRVVALVAAAEATGHAPLQAEIHVMVGRLRSGAGDWPAAAEEYEAAYALAVEHGHDEITFDSAISLARVEAEGLGDFEAADRWLAYARAVLERRGDAITDRARYEEARGVLARREGDVSGALTHSAASVELRSRDVDAPPWLHGTALHHYANALTAAGRIDEALAARERALALLERELGPDHPLTSSVRYAYGADLQVVDRLDEAQVALERTLDGFRRRVSPEHPAIVMTLNELGLILRRRDEDELARDRFVEAFALAERAKGRERDDLVLGIGSNLAEVHIALYEPAAAEALLRQLVTLGDRTFGDESVRVAMNRVRLARAIFYQGRADEAESLVRRALEHAQAGDAPDIAAHAQFQLARIVAERDPVQARSLAQAALAYWRDPRDIPTEGTPFGDSAATNAGLVESWLRKLAD